MATTVNSLTCCCVLERGHILLLKVYGRALLLLLSLVLFLFIFFAQWFKMLKG